MKITKYEHACLDIQHSGTRLVIDPGTLSVSFTNYANIDALIITHVHADHFDEAKVQAILQQNPAIQIFTTQEVAQQLGVPGVQTPQAGDVHTVNGIELEFFGGQHATISPSQTPIQNIGVLVN